MITKRLLFSLTLTCLVSILFGQDLITRIEGAIKNNDTLLLNTLKHEQGFSCAMYLDQKQSVTALSLAIKKQKPAIVNQLLRFGADPNQVTGRKTPLVHAIQVNNLLIIKRLIEAGANVNHLDPDGFSPIFYTLRSNNLPIAKQLIEAGAQLLVPDKNGKKFIDRVDIYAETNYAKYIKHVAEFQKETPFWPVYEDGPHVIHLPGDSIKVIGFKHDSLAPTPVMVSHDLASLKENSMIVSGIHPDSIRYKVNISYKASSGIVVEPEKLLLIGDLHGQFKSLRGILKKHRVIDASCNWIWGNGTLAFVGDVFDRGNEVTKSLWLIQRLQDQATMHGGKVLIILGNHEFLTLLGDETYLNQKYQRLCKYFMIQYAGLYNEDSELGRWIRTWPGMLKIGNTLVIHAGISREFMAQKMPIDTVNYLVNNFLNTYSDSLSEAQKLILLEKGPFWFRGFVPKYNPNLLSEEGFIDSVLAFYDVKRIVFGHSEVNEVFVGFNGKLFGINVPFGRDGIRETLLLIENNKTYLLYADGTKQEVE
jgi:hypothetical protein